MENNSNHTPTSSDPSTEATTAPVKPISRFEEITGMNISFRQVKLGIYSFLMVFVISLFTIKPFLARALYHNFADIDDYRIFENREVKTGVTQPWEVGAQSVAGPDAKTQALLDQLDTTALLMVDQGKIVYEKYDRGGGVDELHGSFSMAKSIVAILTGFALQDGAITNVENPIKTWITEWTDRPEGDIRIRDLLSMSSGLNWVESYQNPFSVTTESYYGWNLIQTALKQRLSPELQTGKDFKYQSGSTELMGLVLSRAVNQNLSDYASVKLWKPIGAEKPALWSLDHADNPNEGSMHPPVEKAFCCFNARARDFAKIGQFVLQQGQWGGTPLLNAAWVKEMVTPKVADYYGYQWWVLNTPQGPIPYARGILGQYIVVVPQKNRVIVRLGKQMGQRIDHHPEEVRALVEWALNS
jgi:CubicO group peptidase (beta-lactamase class C family)